MTHPPKPERRLWLLRFLLATVLLPVGAATAPLGIGILILAVGFALIFPDS